jgi:hypothetical protein
MKKKITTGFVVQEYNDDGICTGQEFVAGDQVDWEDDDGNSIDCPGNDTYQPFEMVQPETGDRIFQITLRGYRSETDETDHLVKWIAAPNEDAIDRMLIRLGLHTAVAADIMPITHNINREDLDFIVDKDGNAVTPRFIGGEHEIAKTWQQESLLAMVANLYEEKSGGEKPEE